MLIPLHPCTPALLHLLLVLKRAAMMPLHSRYYRLTRHVPFRGDANRSCAAAVLDAFPLVPNCAAAVLAAFSMAPN